MAGCIVYFLEKLFPSAIRKSSTFRKYLRRALIFLEVLFAELGKNKINFRVKHFKNQIFNFPPTKKRSKCTKTYMYPPGYQEGKTDPYPFIDAMTER